MSVKEEERRTEEETVARANRTLSRRTIMAPVFSVVMTVLMIAGVVTGVIDAETAAANLLPILNAVAYVGTLNVSIVNGTGANA